MSRIAALLYCNLRHAGQGLAILIERRGVADDEDLGMPRHGSGRLNANPPRAIGAALSHLPAGDGDTPAVQITVLLKIRSPPTMTPSASI